VGDVSTLGSMASALRVLAAAPADLLVRGTVVDEQYEIERVLGAGAMGVVYLARDRRLERNVAIKVVKDASPTALARASREAVALARLSHPNVVVIHQVGELAGRVYVAMEYVAGKNGREWAITPRELRDVLAVYLEVGEGLAAAHAAGLVHRDFKPDNVLVGDDGRARVADFGLARSPVGDATGEAHDGSAMAGTPAYMAPEQVRGEPIDARADQFAYCTSLWEALYGIRPFFNATIARRIPRHVDAALRRGLATDRDARWPSMAPLLAELRRDPTRQRRNIALAVVAPIVVAAGVFLATRGTANAADACEGGAARIADRWGAPQAAQLKARFAPAGAPAWDVASVHAAITATDEWAVAWGESYRNVCRAGWSAALHDRGMMCLAHAEHGLTGTLEALATPSIAATKLDAIIANLPRPEPCADAAHLDADVPPPNNAAIAAAVTTVESELQRHRALAAAGETQKADAVLVTIESAHPLGYPPLAAKIHLARAQMMWTKDDPKAIDALEDTYFEARAVGARSTAVGAAQDAAMWLLDQSHDADAAQWARLAVTESETVGDPVVKTLATIAQANIFVARNQPEQAIELATRALGVQHGKVPHSIDLLTVRADAYDKLGRRELALADATERVHACVAVSETNVCAASGEIQRSLILVHMNRTAEAIAAARYALGIAEKIDAPHGTLIGNAKGMLGTALIQGRQYQEALTLLDESLAIDIQIFGASSYNVASDHGNRCDLLTQMGRPRDGVTECKQAVTMFLDTVGKDSTEMAIAQNNLAGAELAADDTVAAAAASAEAIRIFAGHPDDPMIFAPLMLHAAADQRLDRFAEAQHDLDAAEKFVSKGGADRPFELALARAAQEFHDGHTAKARELAIVARDGYTNLHDNRSQQAAAALARYSK
jgi:eukaryotic-like serine/threonine-protein kinase